MPVKPKPPIILLCDRCGHTNSSRQVYPKCRKCGAIIQTTEATRRRELIDAQRAYFCSYYGWPYRSVDEVWSEEQVAHPFKF